MKNLKDGMKIKILICGLPESGKTTLAKKLQEELGYAWFNADIVREQFEDWDFSLEGRKRQAKRMFDLCEGIDKSCIADFVAPTEELRKIFDADITIWMNTTKKSKYQDTNAIFETPKKLDIVVEDFKYNIDDIIRLINIGIIIKEVTIKNKGIK